MDPTTLAAISVFIAPYLQKAGERVAEKTIEILFKSRKDIAKKFTELFRNELISLDLKEPSFERANQLVAENPQIRKDVDKILKSNQNLLEEMALLLSRREGRTITTKTYIEYAENLTINQ